MGGDPGRGGALSLCRRLEQQGWFLHSPAVDMTVTNKIGWVLAFLGVIALLLGTVKLKTKQDVFSVGDFKASTTSEKTHPKLRNAGIGLIAVGGLVAVLSWRRPRG